MFVGQAGRDVVRDTHTHKHKHTQRRVSGMFECFVMDDGGAAGHLTEDPSLVQGWAAVPSVARTGMGMLEPARWGTGALGHSPKPGPGPLHLHLQPRSAVGGVRQNYLWNWSWMTWIGLGIGMGERWDGIFIPNHPSSTAEALTVATTPKTRAAAVREPVRP